MTTSPRKIRFQQYNQDIPVRIIQTLYVYSLDMIFNIFEFIF